MVGGGGSGGSAGLVLSLSFKLILWWQGRGLQSHKSEVLFVLFDLCRFCLGLCPLGFDSLLSLDWFLYVSVSFWVLISIFFGLISQFSSLALDLKLHDNSDQLNRWPSNRVWPKHSVGCRSFFYSLDPIGSSASQPKKLIQPNQWIALIMDLDELYDVVSKISVVQYWLILRWNLRSMENMLLIVNYGRKVNYNSKLTSSKTKL